VDVQVSRASAVIVQRVPAEAAQRFMEWQRGVTAVAEGFPGYRGTEVYPPADPQQGEWVVVIHFDSNDSLRRWLDSPERARWVERLRTEVGDFQLRTLPGGFGPWFAGLDRGPEAAPPPSWKFALTVLLALYPTVMLLTVFPGMFTKSWWPAVAMLLSNALSVSLLQWAVTPVLTRLLVPWLKARGVEQRRLTVAGTVLIVFLLVALALLFHWILPGG
jgi:antibiotic biosynthesis monooxygenase (ABM) superfamily enzyme